MCVEDQLAVTGAVSPNSWRWFRSDNVIDLQKIRRAQRDKE
jgi:hypothetical protein